MITRLLCRPRILEDSLRARFSIGLFVSNNIDAPPLCHGPAKRAVIVHEALTCSLAGIYIPTALVYVKGIN
jgi:hypothetical protein